MLMQRKMRISILFHVLWALIERHVKPLKLNAIGVDTALPICTINNCRLFWLNLDQAILHGAIAENMKTFKNYIMTHEGDDAASIKIIINI